MSIRNTYIIEGDLVYINLASKRYPNKKCVLDLLEFESKIKRLPFLWRAHYNKTGDTFYACYLINRPEMIDYRMHRIILGLPPQDNDQYADHLDHNGLNNRRNNLQIKTKAENTHNSRRINPRNTSGHRNVDWNAQKKRWRVQISLNNKRIAKNFKSKERAIEFSIEIRKKYINDGRIINVK